MLDIQRVHSLRGWRAVRRLIEAYVLELGVDLSFQGLAEELENLSQAYPTPGGAWLAFEKEEAVGCVALRPLAQGTAELKRLYTSPRVRGSGVGRALVARALEAARSAGFRTVQLDTVRGMEAAQALYTSLGFAPIPPYRENPLPGAQFLALVFPGGGRLPP